MPTGVWRVDPTVRHHCASVSEALTFVVSVSGAIGGDVLGKKESGARRVIDWIGIPSLGG